ncbi:MAG: ROK family protein [Verrucomicrobiota bacterium]
MFGFLTTLRAMEVLGIDIGGNNIKANIVNISDGAITGEGFKRETPHPASLNALLDVLKEIIAHYDWSGPIGVGFPGVIRDHTVVSAANLDHSLVGLNIEEALLGLDAFEASAINEADAAGIAEMKFGAGRNEQGSVLMITVGTGVGTALFYNQTLVPNIELGHAEYRGLEAEKTLSEKARIDSGLTWEDWTRDFSSYLHYLSTLLSLDTIILGGGSATEREEFEKYLSLPCEYKFAKFGDESGIIGAALAIDC